MGGIGAVYAGYDGLNRQLWRNTTNSPTGAYVTYTYDETTAHGYGIGRLTSESFTGGDAGQPLHGSYSYYYGARGEITNFTLTTTENASYSLAYGYNDAGQQTSLTYSDGEVFTTPYNNEDWLAGATTTPSGGSPVNLLSNVTYSGVAGAAGRITNANLGNGTYALSASYDNDLRFTNLTLTNVSLGTTVFGTQRTYDNVGNVIGVNTTLANGTDNQAFCYDSVNRLYWAGSTGTPSCGWSLTPGTLSSANYTATYSYDATNRITGGSLGTLSYGDSSHVHGATSSTSGETAAYDAAGDMQCRAPTSAVTCAGTTPTGASLNYDAERRLSHWQNAQTTPTSQVWYLYDGDGNRVEQYVSGGSGNHTYYLPSGVEEVTPSGTLLKYYSAGGMQIGVNTAHDASGISYLASDGLGSVSEALNGSGTATGAQLYSPYGGVRYTSGVMPTSKGFTGQYADPSTGLDYYGARYYDPTLGQFTAADTVTDGANRYGYVAGNPETFTDPTGHRLWAGGDAGGGGGSGPGTSNNGGGGGGGGHKHNGGNQNGGGFWGAVLNVGGQVLDATTGIPSMIKDVQTIFDGSASTGDKLWAGADLIFNVAMDVTMVIGVGEGVRAFYMGGKIAADVAEHVGEEALEHGGEDALEHGAACGLSFAASTLVAVPGGKRTIASLKVGDKVTAYDPQTGKTSTQTVEATYINHDTDLLDVTLRVSAFGLNPEDRTTEERQLPSVR